MIAAEQSVIGACLLDAGAFWRVSDRLQPEDFEESRHRILWRAIGENLRAGKGADAVTLGDWIEANGLESVTGGSRYILELANTTHSAANVVAYADIVADRAALRRLASAGAAMVRLAGERDAKPLQVVAEARRMMADAMPADARAVVSAREAVRESFRALQARFEAKDELSGISTGIPMLDDVLDGLQGGKVYYIAARPSVGKSLMAGIIGSSFGRLGKRIAIFSAEMQAHEWTDRWVSAIGRIPQDRIQRPRDMDDGDWPKVTAAMQEIQSWPVFIDDSPVHSWDSIVGRSETMHAAAPLSGIIIDHLGLLNHKIAKGQNLVDAIGDTTKAIKQFAKAKNIPIIVLVQLSRDCEGRDPLLTDMRSSGRIEEDADVVIMLHRPGMTSQGIDLSLIHI